MELTCKLSLKSSKQFRDEESLRELEKGRFIVKSRERESQVRIREREILE